MDESINTIIMNSKQRRTNKRENNRLIRESLFLYGRTFTILKMSYTGKTISMNNIPIKNIIKHD